MNKLIRLDARFGLIMALGIMWSLIACDGGSQPKKNLAVSYLLPQLRTEQVNTFSLSSEEGVSQLSRNSDHWWVQSPVDYLADQQAVESFLRILADAEIGKHLKVTAADLKQLQLQSGDGIEVTLGFSSGEVQKLIIGALDFPEDVSRSGLLGAGYSARRYVRKLNENSEDTDQLVDVYLVPMALIDLSSEASLWTDFEAIRIASFHQLKIDVGDTQLRTYQRKHMFGPIYRVNAQGEDVEVPANKFKCFEAFLARGENVSIGERIKHSSSESSKNIGLDSPAFLQVQVKDFLGLTYRFDFGERQEPTQAQQVRAELAMGMLNSGQAQPLVHYRLGVVDNKKSRNDVELTLVENNILVAKNMADRVAVAQWSQVSCLLDPEKK